MSAAACPAGEARSFHSFAFPFRKARTTAHLPRADAGWRSGKCQLSGGAQRRRTLAYHSVRSVGQTPHCLSRRVPFPWSATESRAPSESPELPRTAAGSIPPITLRSALHGHVLRSAPIQQASRPAIFLRRDTRTTRGSARSSAATAVTASNMTYNKRAG